MKVSCVAPQGDAQPAKRKERAPLSERKLKANRENAKKSTGPKTARGKVFSRRNAIKHGLFVNRVTDFEALREDPEEYDDLLQGLWDHYQPVGRAEEIEVERIAICNWRLKRAWRYENAVNLDSRRDIDTRQLERQRAYCRESDKEEKTLIAHLHAAKKELEDTGQISAEVKQKIFASPDFEGIWLALENEVQQEMEEPSFDGMTRKSIPQLRLVYREMCVVNLAITLVGSLSGRRWANVEETAIGRHAIPNIGLEKLLRYETTTERFRSRAHEQLERLQRRRLGEFVPPPVRVQLS